MELILATISTHLPPVPSRQPLPVALPSPTRAATQRGRTAFTALQVLLDRPTTHSASLPISPLGLIGSLIPEPPGNPVSPPWVTHISSSPCRPHTPCYDRGEPYAFTTIVQARPFPTLADRFVSFDYDPVMLRMPFGFHLTMDTLPSGCLLQDRA